MSLEYHQQQIQTYNHTYILNKVLDGGGRISTNNPIKMKYFPTHKTIQLLSNCTIQAICRYVMLDYTMLDYTLPEPCQNNYDVAVKQNF